MNLTLVCCLLWGNITEADISVSDRNQMVCSKVSKFIILFVAVYHVPLCIPLGYVKTSGSSPSESNGGIISISPFTFCHNCCYNDIYN